MNVFNFIGRVGRDAEVRFTSGGDAVAQFSVAVDSGYGDKKKTSWVKCSIWGKRAESLAPYITKGDRIGVTGELSLDEWTNKDGEKQVSLAVRVNDVALLGEKRESAAPKPAPAKQRSATVDFDDDVPF